MIHFPKETVVNLESPFVDGRGLIQNIVHHTIGSAVFIESKRGSIRAEHWHKKDFHYCYLIKGKLIYLEREVGHRGPPRIIEINAGTLFFTPPRVEHSMIFLEDSAFLTMGGLSRTHDEYEDDLVRLSEKLSELEYVSDYVARQG